MDRQIRMGLARAYVDRQSSGSGISESCPMLSSSISLIGTDWGSYRIWERIGALIWRTICEMVS
jgi:hypothetical protein